MKNYTFIPTNIKSKTKIKDYLKSIGISNQVIKDLSKEFGLIKINDVSKTTIDYIYNNDVLKLTVKENEKNDIILTPASIKITYEDEYFLVVYKPYGIATIPSYANYTNSLANFVCYYMHKKDVNFIFRAINRLDKDAQGYVVIAKDKLIYSLLKKNIQKFYTCFCLGKLDKQVISSKILTVPMQNGRNELLRQINNCGKESNTNIIETMYDKSKNITKAKIYITTGRTHQIRLHLSSIGHPIIGDALYGKDEKNIPLQLYCNEIYIFHPILHKTLHYTEAVNY